MSKLRQALGIIILFILASIDVSAVGFSHGNDFSALPVMGHLQVNCHLSNGQIQLVQFFCRDSVLLPSEYDYFWGPASISADTVELSVVHADGSVKAKSLAYDSSGATSHSRFNLWVKGLFQSPLLDIGANHVRYTLFDNGKSVGQGNFTVNVRRMAPASCQSAVYDSYDPNDCQDQITSCGRYFSDSNYCHQKR